MIIPTGTKISQTLGEIAIAVPIEQVGNIFVAVSAVDDDILIIPSDTVKFKIYRCKVSAEDCDCPGFTYHGRCKHCRLARNVRMQREQRKHYVQPLRVLGVAA